MLGASASARSQQKKATRQRVILLTVVRPEGFELPTLWFED